MSVNDRAIMFCFVFVCVFIFILRTCGQCELRIVVLRLTRLTTDLVMASGPSLLSPSLVPSFGLVTATLIASKWSEIDSSGGRVSVRVLKGGEVSWNGLGKGSGERKEGLEAGVGRSRRNWK